MGKLSYLLMILAELLLFNSANVDTLYHDDYYEFQLFAEDLAGNKSDTVNCTATRAGNGYFKA